jgi:hypothetical protein
MICMEMCGSGVKTIGTIAIKVPLLMAVLGLTPIKQINICCCGAVPGTAILGIAGLLIATTIRAMLLTTLLVSESVASRLGFFLVLKPLALRCFLALSYSPSGDRFSIDDLTNI